MNAAPFVRRRLFEILSAGPSSGPRAILAVLLRVASGAVFLIFGLAKFTSHGAEVDSFRSYGLPSPDTFVYMIGTLEMIGALFLFAGFATRFTALLLAGNMAAAIVISGLGEGEIISLTLAPALLISMLFLIRVGPGRYALDSPLQGSAPRSL